MYIIISYLCNYLFLKQSNLRPHITIISLKIKQKLNTSVLKVQFIKLSDKLLTAQ